MKYSFAVDASATDTPGAFAASQYAAILDVVRLHRDASWCRHWPRKIGDANAHSHAGGL